MTSNDRGPKIMSSRLATMKFMQRGKAGAPTATTSPAAKRQRVSSGAAVVASPPQTASQSTASPQSKSVPNHTADSHADGDEWYFSFRAPEPVVRTSALQFVSAGFSTLDDGAATSGGADDSEEDDNSHTREVVAGRKSFGRFNKKIEGPRKTGGESSEEEDGDEDEEAESTGNTAVDALIAKGRREAGDRIRDERRAKRKSDQAEFRQHGEDRRKKAVKLNNRMRGISSGGRGS